MQEYGWLHWQAFGDMVDVIGGLLPGSRKPRLAACALIRRQTRILEVPRLGSAVELAEGFADHRASKEQVKAARRAVNAGIEQARHQIARDKASVPAWVRTADDAESWLWGIEVDLPLTRAANLVLSLLNPAKFGADDLRPMEWQIRALLRDPAESLDALWCASQINCAILRDIFGNPFRPVAFDPAWRTSTAIAIAAQMYESRDFSPMPILADALQDAGCDNDDLLTHCRGGGVHVRGCWGVDLVVGKA